MLKIVSLSLVVVVACLTSYLAEAQIVYTDVVPDTVISSHGGVYHLDLNNDSIWDFELNHYYFSYNSNSNWHFPCLHISATNRLTVDNLNSVAANSGNVSALQAFSLINVSQVWNDTSINHGVNNLASHSLTRGFCTTSLDTTSGDWYGESDRYLGLLIRVNGATYYGWARLSFSGADSFTIYDYAYNSIPGQAILAGDTGSGVTGMESFTEKAFTTVYPNPVNGRFWIDAGTDYGQYEITITDVSGRLIYKAVIRDAQKTEINATDFSPGLYTVQLHSNGRMMTSKLIVTR